MPQVSSTKCRVDIIAPTGAHVRLDAKRADSELLRVETHKDLAEACGSFTLHFAPTHDAQGRTWNQRIPRRSLVYIAMERGMDVSEGTSDPIVMVGLTDTHMSTADYSRARPNKVVTIHGREMSSILLDAQLWYHPFLAADPSIGILTARSQALGEQQLALTYNPKLSRAGDTPQVILKRILDYYLFVGGGVVEPADTPGLQQPIMNLDLPNVSLADLLDTNEDTWTTFEEGITVPITHNTIDVGSLWNYLHLFIDRYFQEFFTRIEEGVCKIFFRGKPFKQDPVTAGTRFVDNAPTLQTLTLDEADILSETMVQQTEAVYNIFLAVPRGVTQYYDNPSFIYKILPATVKEVEHPSFIGRYGLHPMIDYSPYLSPFPLHPATTKPAEGVSNSPPPAGAAVHAPSAAKLAAENGIPPSLIPTFVALMHGESNFKPDAKSPTGHLGIGQLSPANIARFGIINPFDPVESMNGGARYFQELRATPGIGNDPEKIVAAYNAGPDAILAAHGIPNFPETQRHVRTVTGLTKQYMKYDTTPATGPTATATTGTPAPASANQADLTALIDTAQRWSRILRAWYDMGGELMSRVLVVRGDARWNVAHRLLSTDMLGDWEAYIEGVSHSFDQRTGAFHTTLRLTRGWYLSGAVAEQFAQEGQTTMEVL